MSAQSVLAGLKLVAAQRPTQLSPVQTRRERLGAKIDEQIQLAQALKDGTTPVFMRSRRVKDEATGNSRVEQAPKRVRAWWWKAENGKVVLAVRYGAKTLELTKGKFAVEVASESDLMGVFNTLRQAVNGGELDAQLEAASKTARAAFKR